MAAAVAAQRARDSPRRGQRVSSYRVRMGLHVGEATERDGDWFGSDVNRVARVTAAGHGGQILCTAQVATQVRGRSEFLDLGDHRLRDLQTEIRIYQVTGEDLPATFPPLRSLDAYRSNLPYELSSFVGRDAAIRAVADRVRSARLVSIVGVGGVGKTRFALQVASEVLPHFSDGVWLCELASVLDPDDILDSVAAALGYTPPQGVSVEEGLPRFLERKELLLVLDNCEHLVSAVARFVTAVTATAARVSVLATSREALDVPGEHAYPLASLQMPDANDAVAVLASEAGALFVARAEEARGELTLGAAEAQAVHDLCERLDGIPLAIELAAAQTRVMTVTEVLTRLDKQFRLITGGRRGHLERHQTLRAAIDWSYDLLSDEERALFARLSVCVGGFDLDAAAALAAGIGIDEFDAFEILAALVSKSLVERADGGPTTRYRLLEMIRQYAAEQLSYGVDGARDDHARHYLAVATQLFEDVSTADTFEPLERLELETPNIGTAARWVLFSDGAVAVIAFFERLPFLDPFSVPVVTVDELGAIAVQALEDPEASHLAGTPNACFLAGYNLFFTGDRAGYRVLTDWALETEHGPNSAGVAVMAATAALFDGALETVVAECERSVECAKESGDVGAIAWMLANLASMRSIMDPHRGLTDCDEAVDAARRVGGTVIRLYPLLSFASAARRLAPARALEAAEELLRIDGTRRRTYANVARGLAAETRVAQGAFADGLSLWVEVLHALEADGERTLFTLSLSSLAGAIASLDAPLAIELGAIVESHAIVHMAAFTTQSDLVELAVEHAEAVAVACERASGMTYDEAVTAAFAAVDRAVAAAT